MVAGVASGAEAWVVDGAEVAVKLNADGSTLRSWTVYIKPLVQINMCA